MDQQSDRMMKVDMRVDGGLWRVVVESGGQRREMAGLAELIRYLEALEDVGEPLPPRGLR